MNEEVKQALIRFIKNEQKSICDTYNHYSYKWHMSYGGGDRKDLGIMITLEDEELFLERLISLINSIK